MSNRSTNMLELHWSVDRDGYEFVEFPEQRLLGYSPETVVDMALYIRGKGGPNQEYYPFSGEFAVHRELAMLNEDDSDEVGVLEFCKKFGLLDHSLPEGHARSERSSSGGTKLRQRSSGEFMQTQELFAVEGFWHYQRDVRQAVMALDSRNKVEAIRLFNCQTISVVPKIQFEETRRHHPWQLIPRTLISAIWLLIEEEISNGKNWKRCQTCQKWFVPRTKKQIHCKDACKSKGYRRRRSKNSS
jgi:hypothetical protein